MCVAKTKRMDLCKEQQHGDDSIMQQMTLKVGLLEFPRTKGGEGGRYDHD